MALKKFRPITPSLRELSLTHEKALHKGSPVKSLTVGLARTGGRNNHGHITTRHIGGGHKRSYRLVDFLRNNFEEEAVVQRIEYDPNRTAYIALIEYKNGVQAYIIAPQKLVAGDKVISGEDVDVKPGNAMPLRNIPLGTLVHNVEMKPKKGGQIARSAGAYAQLTGKDGGLALLKLRSGEMRLVPLDCRATIGVVSNSDHMNQNFGKAGRMRWLGVRPTVRGVAMNPVDHPHGGGEGKTSGGRHPVSPTGKPTKGKRTRTNKSTSKFILRRRYQ